MLIQCKIEGVCRHYLNVSDIMTHAKPTVIIIMIPFQVKWSEYMNQVSEIQPPLLTDYFRQTKDNKLSELQYIFIYYLV